MATVNFSVPEQIKEEFNRCFAGQNKSAILSRLMQDAIEQHKRQQRRVQAIDELLTFRKTQPPISDQEIAKLRQELRE